MELSSPCYPGFNESLAPILLRGRVLTRANVQRSGDTVLEYLIKTVNGPVKVEVHNQRPMAFCHSDDVERLLVEGAETEVWSHPLELQSFSRQPVHAIYCRTGLMLKRLVNRAQELGIALYEADIKPEQRFLIERFVALDAEFFGHFDSSGPSRFVASRVRATSQHIPLKAVSLDIECSMSGELYSIGLYGDCEPKVIIVGEGETELTCHRDGVEHKVAVEWACDEVALLLSLQRWFMEVDPDILLGWAVVTFDLSLLWRRAKHHGMRLCIGRFGKPLAWKVEDKDRKSVV